MTRTPNRPRRDQENSVSFLEPRYVDAETVRQTYALLQETLGVDAVEDFESFQGTISPETDSCVVPRLVWAHKDQGMIGCMVGAYLRNLNAGFIAYAGVKPRWRRQGIYTGMRKRLLALLDSEAAKTRPPESTEAFGVDCVISEQDGDGILLERYLNHWNARVVPCAYEQPEEQGLRPKPMYLLVQPVRSEWTLDRRCIINIVTEIYRGIYRIRDVEKGAAFRRIVASIDEYPGPVDAKSGECHFT